MSGLSSSDKATLYSDDGYGSSMSGTQTSAYDSVLSATGSKGLANLIANVGSPLAALIGLVSGVQGGETETYTKAKPIDPRMAQYLYGTGYGDTNSLLGAAHQLWQQNKSGLNEAMQQGLDMQRAALTDPAYGQSYQQMRNLGTSLMGGGVAVNPFSTGQASLGQPAGLLAPQPTVRAGGVGGLLSGSNEERAKALIASGRGLLG